MEGPISFLGYKEQKSNLILPKHDGEYEIAILIFSYHLSLGFPNDPFLSGFPTKNIYPPLLSLYLLHVLPINIFEA